MNNDKPVGAASGLFPPRTPSAGPQPRPPAVQLARDVLDVNAVRSGDPLLIQAEIEKIITAIRPPGHLEERGADGGLRLSSMNAVFAISVIDRALGGGVLPRLRKRTKPADFRTSATVGALVARLFTLAAVAA